MDYYKRLGVNKTASPDEIKKAYKKLAMQHHPDRGGNQRKFQEINEAYDTLKDPQKRKQYDNPQPEINMNSQNFEDVFSQFFGQRRPMRRNKDVKIACDITLQEVATGKDTLAVYRLANGQECSATIRIHPGVHHGQVIRFQGLGDNSHPQMPRGDLLVLIRVKAHPHFERDRHHIKTKIDVSIFELILGCTYVVEGLTGSPIRVTIPKNTAPNTILSIAGYGLPDPTTNRQGNLYVQIKGVIPQLTQDEIKKVKEIHDATSSRSR